MWSLVHGGGMLRSREIRIRRQAKASGALASRGWGERDAGQPHVLGRGTKQSEARGEGNRGSGAARAVALSEESGEGAVGEVGDEADVQAPRVRGRREERRGQPDGPWPKRRKGKARGGLG